MTTEGFPTPDTPEPPIRVLLADDHTIVRHGVRSYLNITDDITVIGEARNGQEAVQLARDLAPDVVLMDLAMPELDGIAATAAIKAERRETEIIALTSFMDEDHVIGALKAGALGYLLKDAEPDEVIRAVRSAHRGEAHLDPRAAKRLVLEMAAPRAPERDSALSPREREVLILIARGLGNKEIARELHLSDSTVRVYVSAILSKLGLVSRTQAAVYAVRMGLVPAPE